MINTGSPEPTDGNKRQPSDARPKAWGDRVCTPDETGARLRPFLSQMGITRVADVTGLDRIGIPVVQAIRPMGRSLSVSQGKGMTLAAARASAMMESAEGWHAENLDGPFTLATGLALEKSGVMDGLPMAQLPDADHPLTLLDGYELNTGATVSLPLDLIGKDYTVAPQHPGFHRTTNGLASGNTLNEAIVSGLHEVIERDALADFGALSGKERAQRLCKPALLHALGGDVTTLLDLIAAADFHVFIHDLTNDLGVPVIRATLFSVDQSMPGHGRPRAKPNIGVGCHLNPATAAVRAITEAAQSRLTCIAGARDDLADARYETVPDGNLGRLLSFAADMQSLACVDAFPDNLATPTAQGDLNVLTQKLTTAGLEKTYVVDLSKNEFPINVARVLVPGLGFLTGKGPQRGSRYRSNK